VALGDTDLGDDVLEGGPGYGATTDATALAYDDGRFSGAASLTMLHHVPTVDPSELRWRPATVSAATAGDGRFERIDVRTNPYGWAVIAHEA
jgi:hypothetical protein